MKSSCNNKRSSLRHKPEVDCNKTIGSDANETVLTANILSDPISPEGLAIKLNHYCKDLLANQEVPIPDLADFNQNENVDNLEKLHELRQQLRKKVRHFDDDGRTNVRLEGAAIAGAKLLVAETRATRSLTKKLASDVGANEDNLLYHGLPYEGSEAESASTVSKERDGTIVESFVDFQKQLQFKLRVLNHAAKKVEAGKLHSEFFSAPKLRSRSTQLENVGKNKRKHRVALKTPKQKNVVNPLQHTRIIDNYALEVASDLVERTGKRRKIAPIPFDLHILDSPRR